MGGSFEKMHGWSLSLVGPRVDVAAVKAPRELVSGGQSKLGPRVNNLERFRTQMCILKELGPSRHFWERIRTALAFYSQYYGIPENWLSLRTVQFFLNSIGLFSEGYN